METTKKPRKTGGKGKIGPEDGKRYSKSYQPTSEAKRIGWLKKKRGQELAKAILELQFKGMKDSQLKKAASEYFGIAQKDLTVEMMIIFRQAEKAIQKADTQAATFIMDRSHGKPKEKIELKTPKVGLDFIEETYE